MCSTDDLTELCVVDNRIFILGLDELYRESMAELESTRLLGCARTVARKLGVTPATVPVAGYYTESAELTEYFLLMRALQELDERAGEGVRSLPEFTLLHAIATSGLYGSTGSGELLPRGIDPLYQALEQVPAPEWSVPRLAERAHEIACASEDFSLVALAARTANPVLLAATRETVVLYGRVYSLSSAPIEYSWQVDDDLARLANRFIQTFNQFGPPLPPAELASAGAFYSAGTGAYVQIGGRCVVIADDPVGPRYYHWAIAGNSPRDQRVEDFWDNDQWTSERYAGSQIIKGGW